MLSLLALIVGCWLAAVEPEHAKPGELLLVSFSGEDMVAAIDPRSGRLLQKVAVGKEPHEIALTRDRTRAFVATTGGRPEQVSPDAPSAIASIDLRGARAAAAKIDIGKFQSPHDVRASSDGNTVWVACAPAQTVLEIDARSGRQIAAWRTGADGGWFVAVTPDGAKIYVPHLEGKRVTAIDRTRKSVAVVLNGGAQSGIDVSPDGREVWAADHERRTINVIDTASDRVIGHVPLASDAFARIRFTPDGAKIVVVQEKMMTIIDARGRKNAAQFALPFPGKVLDVSPAADRVAVSHPGENRVSIIGLKDGAVVASISTGRTPDGVAWVR
jgi:DNA-binding beta-propeller fold protein YncE